MIESLYRSFLNRTELSRIGVVFNRCINLHGFCIPANEKTAIASSDPRSLGGRIWSISQPFSSLHSSATASSFDVLSLRALVSAAQQNDDLLAPSHEINSVPRPIVDAQFADSPAHRLHIPRIPIRQPIKSRSASEPVPASP